MHDILRTTSALFLRPAALIRAYDRHDLRFDLLAGLTVAVVLLPQAIVFSYLAGVPPQMGLYAAVVAAITGALWGSSKHLQTGPTNTASILVASVLGVISLPAGVSTVQAAGMLAVMSGGLRIVMGVARLGMLVSFVSDSVVVGFAAGAGILIIVGEIRNLLRLDYTARALPDVIQALVVHLPLTHLPTFALAVVTLIILVLLPRFNRKLPVPLIVLAVAGLVAAILRLDQFGIAVIGQFPIGLPPLANLPLFNLSLIGDLSTGALAIAAIGLIEATSIGRAIAAQTNQPLNSNQEFVGQGIANLASGLFSGYPVSGSFNRSALNYSAGARSGLASATAGAVVLVGLLAFGPLIAWIPRAALSVLLVLSAYHMVNWKEMGRILRGTRGDAFIMVVTLLATLFLPLQFAVLSGVLMSLVYYILQTSIPHVRSVVPDDNFRHLVHRPDKPVCPQLGIIDIQGDLYFGAVSHVEESIRAVQRQHPTQRYLLLRMQHVGQCDISGIHMLETVTRLYRERGGDLYLTRVLQPVMALMHATGFDSFLGADHFLDGDTAIEYLFYKVLDPAICIYESDVRVFRECQNLPRPDYPGQITLYTEKPGGEINEMPAARVWQLLHTAHPPLILDVREPREFALGHIAQAQSLPLFRLITERPILPRDRIIVLVCRTGRRSNRAAYALLNQGHTNAVVMQGGMVAWEAAHLLEAVERTV